MSPDASGTTARDTADDAADDPADLWLDVAGAAARAGVQPRTWRAYVARQQAPEPDDPDAGAPPQRRRPRWRTSTIDAYTTHRVGQGRRTDLIRARRDARRRAEVELAAPRPVAAAALQEWLQANHRRLLAVAETLADYREALLDAAAGRRDDLAEAIDRAGEEITGRPSRALASAVAYALFLLGDDHQHLPGPVRETLAQHGRLRAEYNQLRG